jgi:hypothetical protein
LNRVGGITEMRFGFDASRSARDCVQSELP